MARASRVYEGADILDMRDVMARIQELEDATTPPEIDCSCADREDDGSRDYNKPQMAVCGTCAFEWCDRCEPCPAARTPCEAYHSEDDREELAKLRALEKEVSGYGDTCLIADHYFKTYAQDLAEDIGAFPTTEWPNSCIDWDQAAEELKQDYTSVTYGDTEYWIRA